QLLSKSDRNDLPGGKVELILSEGKLQLVALVPHVYALFLADSAKVKLACKRDNIAFDCPIGNDGQSAKNTLSTCAREKSDSIKTTKVKGKSSSGSIDGSNCCCCCRNSHLQEPCTVKAAQSVIGKAQV